MNTSDPSNPNKPPSLTFVGKAGILPLEWSLIRIVSTVNKDRVAVHKATYNLIQTLFSGCIMTRVVKSF